MKERIEKLAVMPFTIGCASPWSTAIKDQHIKKSPQSPAAGLSQKRKPEMKYGSKSPQKDTEQYAVVGPPPSVESSNIFTVPFSKSQLLHRLVKSFRALSQIFVFKDEEMQIGYPTDVKHVAHIGWEGSSASGRSWMADLHSTTSIEQASSSSWIHDAAYVPKWTSNDLFGTLGLPHNVPPEFSICLEGDSKEVGKSKDHRLRTSFEQENLHVDANSVL